MNPGDLVWEYGYKPVVVVSVDDTDDTVEVARFAKFERLPQSDVTTGERGPLPPDFATIAPDPHQGDRIAVLESQLAELLALQKGAPAEPPADAPAVADPTKTGNQANG